MNVKLISAIIGGMLAVGAASASAQEETTPTLPLEGAKVMLTEIGGTEKCKEATPSTVPSDENLTEEILEGAKNDFLDYYEDSEKYRDCLAKVEASHDDLSDEQKLAFTVVDGADVDQVNSIKDQLNALIKKYKAEHPE